METLTSTPTISETIAAMDAVDAARNAEELLNDEINIEERKNILREKLRATYAANNIKVSDEIINKGVNDFFANRYSLKKTPRTIKAGIGWAYVKRAVLGKYIGAVTAIVVCCLIGWIVMGKIMDARKTALVEKAAAAKKAEQTKLMLGEKQALAKKAAEVAELAGLGLQIKTVGETIQKVSKEPAATARSEALVTEGLGALKANDLTGGRKAHTDLKGILAQLTQEYQLLIQQTPQTVLWRTLDRNPSQKRYFAIVNATHEGKPVEVPIVNEEDSKIYAVSKWAEQMSRQDYEALKAEKEGRGVLSNRLFAEKSKGYLQPVYKQGLKATGTNVNAETLRITKW